MIPEEVKQHEQEIFKDFKESLKVYGFSGYCYRQKDIERNEKLEIKFDF